MLNYRLTTTEQETTVNACRADNLATVYTSDRRDLRKLDALCEKFPDTYKRVWTDSQILGDGLPMGARYTVPRKYIRFGRPASAAQVEAARTNAIKMRSEVQNHP